MAQSALFSKSRSHHTSTLLAYWSDMYTVQDIHLSMFPNLLRAVACLLSRAWYMTPDISRSTAPLHMSLLLLPLPLRLFDLLQDDLRERILHNGLSQMRLDNVACPLILHLLSVWST